MRALQVRIFGDFEKRSREVWKSGSRIVTAALLYSLAYCLFNWRCIGLMVCAPTTMSQCPVGSESVPPALRSVPPLRAQGTAFPFHQLPVALSYSLRFRFPHFIRLISNDVVVFFVTTATVAGAVYRCLVDRCNIEISTPLPHIERSGHLPHSLCFRLPHFIRLSSDDIVVFLRQQQVQCATV
jgi:hypothetical protein